jgi:hypothetical protein
MPFPVEFCDYAVLAPDWFISEIQIRINRRDLAGLVNLDAITVHDEHPLVTLTGDIIQDGTPGAGRIPVISVTEDRTTDGPERMGLGREAHEIINGDRLAEWRAVPQKDRVYEGMIGDNQLDELERLIAEHGDLRASVQRDYYKAAVTVALWCEGRKERTLIGRVVESIVRSLKLPLARRSVEDITITTERGLINLDFGRTIRGQETRVEYTAWMRTFSVIGPASEGLAPSDGTVQGDYAPYNEPDNATGIHSDEINFEITGP